MGRKRSIGKREPNGRLSRKPEDQGARQVKTFLEKQRQLEQAERDAIEPGLAARVRIWGVKPSDSRSQMAGSFVGRLCLSGEISRAQYDALLAYQDDCVAYRQAIDSPRGSPSAVNLNATHGRSRSPADDEQFVARATERYIGSDKKGGVCRAIQDKQCEVGMTANLWAALSLCVMEDKDLPHMVGELRVAANALGKHYKLDRRDAA
jgi:hypothetical protein